MKNHPESLVLESPLPEKENRLNTNAGTVSIFIAAHKLMQVAERIRRLDDRESVDSGDASGTSVDRLMSHWVAEQSLHLPGLHSLIHPLSTEQPSSSQMVKTLRTLIDAISIQQSHDSFLGRQAGEEDRKALSILSDAAQSTLQAVVERTRFEQAVEKATKNAIYDFAYGLTHEINNPLANIAARAQQLLSQATSAADQKSLATIVDQSMRAHEMLAEMMRAVKPKAWTPTAVLVSDCIQSLLPRFRAAFQARQVGFEVEGNFNRVAICTEAAEFREAIASLLQNALDACSPSDSVVFSVQATDHVAEFSVKDTGCGMSSMAVENAFSLYYSGREHGRGLGISLANVRRVVDSMRGELLISSSERSGTEVRIRVPTTANPATKRNKRIRIEN